MQRRDAFERQQRLEWERCRWMAYSIFSPFLGKNKPKTPVQWVKFPWEEQNYNVSMIAIDEAQQNALNELFQDFKKQKKI